MKKIFLLPALAFFVLLAGCEKDNKEAPGATLTGRVVYQGQQLGLRSNGVQLELWQKGYQLYTKIPVFVAQDGSFSAKLYDGNYKLTLLKGNGPWADKTDSLDVQVKGGAQVDVSVDPFFLIKDASFSRSGTMVNASFKVQQVNNTKPLELVRMFIGQTLITDQTNNAGNAQKLAAALTDLSQPQTLSVAVPASLASKEFVYARVAVKAVGVAELVYSAPQKIMLK
ncbi:Protein of unknown function [Cnuella takakiae]|uniref:DUF3823 domain-containing protein n=1 Tax=Cnuella takakiae TaxID=1302690 RepID=A0A1M4VCE4_9BACT|nr:DUF3823 domain-containing protein [Cnuella takakiae]OLY92641.1 hypothetical protein BUE76_12645 [Cnuella takakiae]SHE66520.1 Protein of unknown function [Cnuella takakiae]